MKRIKKLSLILFFITLFIPLASAKAATSCAEVKEAVNDYKSIETAYNNKKCDTTSSSKTLAECIDLSVSKAATLKKIFEYNDSKACPSVNLSTIIADNKKNCSKELSSDLKELTDKVMKTFYALAPFILILFGSLDFFKIIAGNNPEEIKKSRSNFIKRLVAFLLLYITPFFVKTLFSLTPYDMDKNTYICTQVISLTPRETSPGVSGEYNPTSNESGDAGKRIADAAKNIKSYVMKHNFTYGYPHLNVEDSLEKNSRKKFCCATLIGVALYKANVYDKKTANSIKSDSAWKVTENLIKRGWKVITKESELKPGDVLVYDTGCHHSGCGNTTIKGKFYYVGHVEIYVGDGKYVSTGDADEDPPGFGASRINVTYKFKAKSGKKVWICGLRYQGK